MFKKIKHKKEKKKKKALTLINVFDYVAFVP